MEKARRDYYCACQEKYRWLKSTKIYMTNKCMYARNKNDISMRPMTRMENHLVYGIERNFRRLHKDSDVRVGLGC